MAGNTVLHIHVYGETAGVEAGGKDYRLHGKGLLETPAPRVYMYDRELVPSEYEIVEDEGGAIVRFEEAQAGSDLTCDYVWTYECGEDETPAVYEFTRDMNVKVVKDCNGRSMIVEACERVTAWSGMIVWEAAPLAFAEELRRIAENGGGSFDITRTLPGRGAETIAGLVPVKYPKCEEKAGVPGLVSVTLEVAQNGQ